MKNILLSVVFLAACCVAQANRIELGLASGVTSGVSGEAYRVSKSGDAQTYWLGYGLDKNVSAELGFDHLDFDGVNTDHQIIYLAGVYRWMPEAWIHPISKLGLGSVTSKGFTTEKVNSIGAKVSLGLEADFKYVSVGTLLNYHYMNKVADGDSFKDVQALVPMIFITFHNPTEAASVSKSQKQEEIRPVVAVAKDSDSDGISDEDDKCPGTNSNVVVNKFGCAEKETASVKINVEFLSGKTNLESKYDSEIANLVSFMKKFTETRVEIAGYTDNKGAKKGNRSLSQKRADSIKSALVKAGIDANRIVAKGYGSENPIADNKTEAGRAQNRRVIANISVQAEKSK